MEMRRPEFGYVPRKDNPTSLSMRLSCVAKAAFIGYRNSSFFECRFQILGEFSALPHSYTAVVAGSQWDSICLP